MVDPKPVSAWAVVSLGSGALGCLAFLALLAVDDRYRDLANASAGLGGVWGALHVTLAILLCLLGCLAGVVALTRGGGRGMAWAGIALGCAPWLISWVVDGVTLLTGRGP